MEGSSSTIDDGDPVYSTILFKKYADKKHAVKSDGETIEDIAKVPLDGTEPLDGMKRCSVASERDKNDKKIGTAITREGKHY